MNNCSILNAGGAIIAFGDLLVNNPGAPSGQLRFRVEITIAAAFAQVTAMPPGNGSLLFNNQAFPIAHIPGTPALAVDIF
jgi:hypothetical protein